MFIVLKYEIMNVAQTYYNRKRKTFSSKFEYLTITLKNKQHFRSHSAAKNLYSPSFVNGIILSNI